MKKILFLLAIFVFCGCNDYEYDDEYWKSMNREKVMRKSGLNDLADYEARMRQDRLRLQKKSSLDGITSNDFAAMTIGVVIFVGFIGMIIHLSTKATTQEGETEQNTSSSEDDAAVNSETSERDDIIGKIERLADLKDRSAITNEEFEREKQKLLK